jgi:hypothetical protein
MQYTYDCENEKEEDGSQTAPALGSEITVNMMNWSGTEALSIQFKSLMRLKGSAFDKVSWCQSSVGTPPSEGSDMEQWKGSIQGSVIDDRSEIDSNAVLKLEA